MIVNFPRKQDYERIAKENLVQSFQILFKVYCDYIEPHSLDEIIQEEVSKDEIWNYHSGTLRTSLVLIHQAVEGLMKASICDASPLLLIDKPRKDWPTLPNGENKDFDSLYTIGGEALLTTFCAIDSNVARDSKIILFVEEIRQKRNAIIHGVNNSTLQPQFLVESILEVFTLWFGKDVWLEELKKHIINNPLFGYFDADFEEAISYRFLDFINSVLSIKRLQHYISLDITGRAYYCPSCIDNLGKYETLESKWAFLNPNLPSSTLLSCINCNETVGVIRSDCQKKDCKGNVLHNGQSFICLTCNENQV